MAADSEQVLTSSSCTVEDVEAQSRADKKTEQEETLPKAQRTRGLSSSCQSHIASSNANLDRISSSES